MCVFVCVCVCLCVFVGEPYDVPKNFILKKNSVS